MDIFQLFGIGLTVTALVTAPIVYLDIRGKHEKKQNTEALSTSPQSKANAESYTERPKLDLAKNALVQESPEENTKLSLSPAEIQSNIWLNVERPKLDLAKNALVQESPEENTKLSLSPAEIQSNIWLNMERPKLDLEKNALVQESPAKNLMLCVSPPEVHSVSPVDPYVAELHSLIDGLSREFQRFGGLQQNEKELQLQNGLLGLEAVENRGELSEVLIEDTRGVAVYIGTMQAKSYPNFKKATFGELKSLDPSKLEVGSKRILYTHLIYACQNRINMLQTSSMDYRRVYIEKFEQLKTKIENDEQYYGTDLSLKDEEENKADSSTKTPKHKFFFSFGGKQKQ